jgi:hypothetical protein
MLCVLWVAPFTCLCFATWEMWLPRGWWCSCWCVLCLAYTSWLCFATWEVVLLLVHAVFDPFTCLCFTTWEMWLLRGKECPCLLLCRLCVLCWLIPAIEPARSFLVTLLSALTSALA